MNDRLIEKINISDCPNLAYSSRPGGKSHLHNEGFLDLSNWKQSLLPLKLHSTSPILLWLTSYSSLTCDITILWAWLCDIKGTRKGFAIRSSQVQIPHLPLISYANVKEVLNPSHPQFLHCKTRIVTISRVVGVEDG